MEDYNENIPDENIQITSPKKSKFLLSNMNMFIKSDKKRNKLEEFIIQNRIHIKKDNKINKKKQNSDEEDELKTIIKEPAILTSNRIIDIKRLINSNSNNNLKIPKKNILKNKKNKQISLYKKIKSKEKFIKGKSKNNTSNHSYKNRSNKNYNNNKNNSNNNSNKNKLKIENKSKNIKNKIVNQRKIDIKLIKNNNDNNSHNYNYNNSNNNYYLTQTTPKQNISKVMNNRNFIRNVYYTNIRSNSKKDILDDKCEKDRFSNNCDYKNKVFVKKLSKEYKNKSMRNSLSINRKEKPGIITKKITIKPEILSPKKINQQNNIIFLTQKGLMPIKYDISDIERNKAKFMTKDNSNKNYNNSIKSPNRKYLIKYNMSDISNKYKSKIYHIDYCNNKKRDLTTIIMGLNAIKDIWYKKLKNIFLKFKKIYVYKRKIVNSKTPKKRNVYNEIKKIPRTSEQINIKIIKKEPENNNNIIKEIKTNYKNLIYTKKRKTYQSEPKYSTFYERRNNSDEFEKVIGKKTKTKYSGNKNNILLLNPNSYINNCNINTIQINLFNNEYMNDLNNLNNDNINNSSNNSNNNSKNKNKIITKTISKKYIKKPYDDFNVIKNYKTSIIKDNI